VKTLLKLNVCNPECNFGVKITMYYETLQLVSDYWSVVIQTVSVITKEQMTAGPADSMEFLKGDAMFHWLSKVTKERITFCFVRVCNSRMEKLWNTLISVCVAYNLGCYWTVKRSNVSDRLWYASQQEAQLSQRSRATLRVIEILLSLKVAQRYSKLHRPIGHM